jgi:hypothetical protein
MYMAILLHFSNFTVHGQSVELSNLLYMVMLLRFSNSTAYGHATAFH